MPVFEPFHHFPTLLELSSKLDILCNVIQLCYIMLLPNESQFDTIFHSCVSGKKREPKQLIASLQRRDIECSPKCKNLLFCID